MVLTGVMSKPHLCSNQQIALSARLSHETFQCYTAMYSAIHRCCFLWIGIYRWIADHHPSSVARLAGGMERAVHATIMLCFNQRNCRQSPWLALLHGLQEG
eukprot:scaffold127745_cov17-Tisochrysis_lutea.AAC.1